MGTKHSEHTEALNEGLCVEARGRARWHLAHDPTLAKGASEVVRDREARRETLSEPRRESRIAWDACMSEGGTIT